MGASGSGTLSQEASFRNVGSGLDVKGPLPEVEGGVGCRDEDRWASRSVQVRIGKTNESFLTRWDRRIGFGHRKRIAGWLETDPRFPDAALWGPPYTGTALGRCNRSYAQISLAKMTAVNYRVCVAGNLAVAILRSFVTIFGRDCCTMHHLRVYTSQSSESIQRLNQSDQTLLGLVTSGFESMGSGTQRVSG